MDGSNCIRSICMQLPAPNFITMEETIIHKPDANRFELEIDHRISFVQYNLFENGIIFEHTEVHPDLEGKAIASRLAVFALEYAKTNHLKVLPLCPFFRTYIMRHKEYESLL